MSPDEFEELVDLTIAEGSRTADELGGFASGGSKTYYWSRGRAARAEIVVRGCVTMLGRMRDRIKQLETEQAKTQGDQNP